MICSPRLVDFRVDIHIMHTIATRKESMSVIRMDKIGKIVDDTYVAPVVVADSASATLAALLFLLHFSDRSLVGTGAFSFFSAEPYFLILFLSASFFLNSINQSGTSAGVDSDGSAIYIGLIPFLIAFARPEK